MSSLCTVTQSQLFLQRQVQAIAKDIADDAEFGREEYMVDAAQQRHAQKENKQIYIIIRWRFIFPIFKRTEY
jgi:hypothetical protein